MPGQLDATSAKKTPPITRRLITVSHTTAVHFIGDKARLTCALVGNVKSGETLGPQLHQGGSAVIQVLLQHLEVPAFVAALTNECSLLSLGGDVEPAKGFVERINPLRANVQLFELFTVYHLSDPLLCCRCRCSC